MEIRLQVGGPVKGADFMEALAEHVPVSDRPAVRVTVRDKVGVGRAFNLGAPGEAGQCVGALNGFNGGEIAISSLPNALLPKESEIKNALMAVLNG